MESSQLRRISIIGISILCLSPVDFFSNRLFSKKEEINNVVVAQADMKLEPNYLLNNYEIFNPNIKTASENIEKLASENKKKEQTESENNLESETTEDVKEKEEDLVVEETIEQIEEPTTVEEVYEVVQPEQTVEVQAQTAPMPNTQDANGLVNYALQFVGNPYSYGGSDLYSGVDCSGFTMKIYEAFGYSLPHSAESQSYMGSYVSLDSLQPGDLIFYGYDGYICHVAIYIGNGQIVHAATSYEGIVTASYQIMPIITARRILN